MTPRPVSKQTNDRRQFLKDSALATTALVTGLSTVSTLQAEEPVPMFDISLAEWSLHVRLQANKMTNLDFPKFTREKFDIRAVEYVNQFFKDKAEDTTYLDDLMSRCDGEGVTSLLIMVDGEGKLGDPDDAQRTKAVENHYRWVTAAKHLGCHSIRVNAASDGSFEEQQSLAADGLRRLSEFAADHQMNVIVENHGGLSSDGGWLAGTIRKVDLPNCGTLPDFGNFNIGGGKWYDRYDGVRELMPFAKAVSAKSHDFDDDGNEVNTDYRKMMQIVADAGYRGYVGIEYEGKKHDEVKGILLTRDLLLKVREEMSA